MRVTGCGFLAPVDSDRAGFDRSEIHPGMLSTAAAFTAACFTGVRLG